MIIVIIKGISVEDILVVVVVIKGDTLISYIYNQVYLIVIPIHKVGKIVRFIENNL